MICIWRQVKSCRDNLGFQEIVKNDTPYPLKNVELFKNMGYQIVFLSALFPFFPFPSFV